MRQVTTRVYRHRSVHSTTAREMIGAVMLIRYMLCIFNAFTNLYVANTMNATDLCRDERGKWRWPVNGADLVTSGIYLGDETTALCTG